MIKLLGLALAMIALSGVGTLSMLSGVKGTRVPLANLLGADLGAGWLSAPSDPARESRPAGPSGALPASAHGAAADSAQGSRATPPLAATLAPEQTQNGVLVTGLGSVGMTPEGKVILNLASREDLRHLPGVGQKRAEAILALRTRLGRFKQVNDLLRVKGIGVRGLKKILPHVVLDGPKPAA